MHFETNRKFQYKFHYRNCSVETRKSLYLEILAIMNYFTIFFKLKCTSNVSNLSYIFLQKAHFLEIEESNLQDSCRAVNFQ